MVNSEIYVKCKYNDCFMCPYEDCIAEIKIKKDSVPTDEQRLRHSARQKARRDARRESGLCVMCGKKLPDGYAYNNCQRCRAKMRKAYKSRGRTPKELLDGITLCAKCGKHPPYDGHKICRRCYENNLAFLSKTPTHNGKKPNNYFRKLNEGFWNEKINQVERTS